MTSKMIVAKELQLPPASAFDSRLFRGFKREKVVEEREPLPVKENRSLAQIFKLWEEIMTWNYNIGDDEIHKNVSEKLKNIDYGAEEVERFCIHLMELKDSYNGPGLFNRVAGIFISSLVNNGRDEEYTLSLNHLDEPLEHVGYYNEKKIRINGNAGWACGLFMKKGRIEVFGDAGGGLGSFMENGEILIHGNVNANEIGDIGGCMTNGRIIIDGDVNGKIGELMSEGQITIKGNVFGKVGELMQGGTIQIGKSVKGDVGKNMNRGTIIIEGDVTAGANGFGVWMHSFDIPGGGQGNVASHLISHKIGSIHVNGKLMHCLLFKPMVEGINGKPVKPRDSEFIADIYHNERVIAANGKTFNCLEAMINMTDRIRRGSYVDWWPSF